MKPTGLYISKGNREMQIFSIAQDVYSNIEATETLSRVFLTAIKNSPEWEDVEKIISELENIPPRDSFELTVNLDGSEANLTNVKQRNLIEELFLEADETEKLKLTIKINKAITGAKVSIYSLEKFTEWLSQKNIIDQINTISEAFDDSLTFLVQHDIEEFGSSTILFTTEKELSHERSPHRARTKELLEENVNLLNLNRKFTPEDFHANIKDVKISYLFSKAKLIYSLAYISNHTEVRGNQRIVFRFNGYKTFTTPEKRPEDLSENCEIAFKIFNWAYSDGKCGDKLGLIRNLITLSAKKNSLNIDTALWQTIQSNYEIYLKDNIANYLELKSSLLNTVSDFNNKALEIADNFTNSFKSSCIGMITFLVTVVAVNGLKDNGPQEIFSPAYILITFLICIISAAWLLISTKDTSRKIKNKITNTRNLIHRNYSTILNIEEINSCIEPTFETIKTETTDSIRYYTILWIASISISAIIFFAGYSFTNTNKEKITPSSYELPKKQRSTYDLKILPETVYRPTITNRYTS